MKYIYILACFVYIFSPIFSVSAQESSRESDLFVAPPSSRGTTFVAPDSDPVSVTLPSQASSETTVVAPARSTAVTLPAPPSSTVVVPPQSETVCTKSVNGQCTIFSCSDGTKTNTCDLSCNNESVNVPVSQTIDNKVVIQSSSKIIDVTPSATYPGSGTPVKVEFSPGLDFIGYNAVIVGDKVVDLYGGEKNSADQAANIVATFLLPVGIFAGPSSLTLTNKQQPKYSVVWSEDFMVTPATDGPSIVSVTPTSGKVGDIIHVKIAKGKKEYNTPGHITIGEMATKVESSTYASLVENGGEYTLSVVLNANNKSGLLKLVQTSGEFAPVTSDSYFTVTDSSEEEKPGIIKIFFTFIGNLFK